MRVREMVAPLNQDDRRRAMVKFAVVCGLTLLLIPCIVLIYDTFPQDYTYEPAAHAREADPALAPSAQPSPETMAEKLQQAILARSNVNLTLLVDATPGMEAYIQAVADVADTISRSYALEVVAACYRDASEGQWMYLDNDMTGEPPATWLRGLSTTVLYDKDAPEAVYYGLRQTLRSPHLAQGESNILVLVGDAGNHAQEPITDVSATSIIDLLMEKQCYLAAIQTRQPTSDPAYAAFGEQLQREIMVPALQRYQDPSFAREDEPEGTAMYSDRKHGYYLFTPGKNQRLTPEALRSKLLSYLDSTVASIYAGVRAAKALQEGNATEQDVALLVTFLQGYGISQQDLQAYQASVRSQ